jgi:membrane dipeptidase
MLRTSAIFATLGALLAAAPAAQAAPDPQAIHRRILELDSHVDVLLPDASGRTATSQADLDQMTRGGIDAVVLAVAVGPGPRDPAGVAAARIEADRKLALIKRFVADHPQRVGLALSASDVERLHREGKTAVLIGFQNARSIGQDLSQIDVLYREGVRIFAFNHAGHNAFSDSSRPGEEPASVNGGLSALGRAAVARLNDLGVLIDVSQLSDEALAQTLQLTRAPVVATHSAARALIDNARNLSDAQLDVIKANGGVVQVRPFAAYIHRQDAASLARIAPIRARYGLPPAAKSPSDGADTLPTDKHDAFVAEIRQAQSRGTLSEYVDHIDHIARRIGWDHVGIGTDFNHGSGIVGFDSEADAPNVTAELVRRGYSEAQIAGIWGGSFLRVLRAAQAARAK